MSTHSSTVPSDRGRSRSGFFARLKTGLKLTRDSLDVLRAYPRLMLFPFLGGAAALVFWVAFLVPLWFSGLIGTGAEFVVLFVLYFLTTFTATFFTASLVFAVNQTFHGEEPDLRESMRAAWRRKWPIFVWSVIAGTVSAILKNLQESDNIGARILSGVFALGWTIMTFFIVPVIVFEDVSVRSMFTRSGQTFRETWGESIGVGMGITLVELGLGIAGIALAVGCGVVIGMLFPTAGLIVGILITGATLVFAYLLGQTIWGITKTALYVYAAEERVPDQFADFDFATLDGRVERPATPGNVANPPRHLDR